MSETNQVLTAPAFPAEFQQALVQQVLKGELTGILGHPFANGIEIVLCRWSFTIILIGCSSQTEFGFGTHQQDISETEQHNIIIHELPVFRGILIHLVFLHAGTGCFHKRTAAQVHGHFAWVVSQMITGSVGYKFEIQV